MRAILLGLVVVSGCTTSRTIGQPNLSVQEEHISLTRRDKVDILFMIDNSPSMAPKQAALEKSFPELVTRIENLATNGLPAEFHIGVVDSDLGAGPYTLNQGQCHPDGDGGKLRTAADPDAANVPAACAGFTLPSGYIDVDTATGKQDPANLDVATAFTCLASVGEKGCGFEQQLESVYRVLTTPALNPGFLRDDALLVVVWLTDEDDCSAPPDSTLFDPSSGGVATYGTLQSFRCTQFGITCDGKPLTGGDQATMSCAPAVGGPLFDVSRYTALFADGGVKASADDVLLVAIDAPPTPVDVAVTMPCADNVSTPSCPILQHSCVSADHAIFGDPAVRLDAVLSASGSSVSASVCDDAYTQTLDSLADAMSARMHAGCLPGAIVDLVDPGCTITLGGVDVVRCTADRLPCWELVDDPGCPERLTPAGASQHYRLAIEGATNGMPVSASCPLYVPAP